MLITVLAVTDIQKSVDFYSKLLGLQVVSDFGANKTLTGGLALQTMETYMEMAEIRNIHFGGNSEELYFEPENFDDFLKMLSQYEIQQLHPVKETPWGQRTVRFYDPDRHLIEAGENMHAVCKRFANSGMTIEQIAKRMDAPVEYVRKCLSVN